MISTELKSSNMPEQFADSNNTDVDARLRAIEEKEENIAALKTKLNKEVLSAATAILITSVLGLSASLIAGLRKL
jgi:hypothetical protein